MQGIEDPLGLSLIPVYDGVRSDARDLRPSSADADASRLLGEVTVIRLLHLSFAP